MPYIDVNLTAKLSEKEKETLKSGLGQRIAILPGKSEAVLMVCIHDDSSIYFAGAKKEKAAFINVKLYKESPFEGKAEFAAQVFEFLEKEFGIAHADIFLTFDEYSSWGAGGALKR